MKKPVFIFIALLLVISTSVQAQSKKRVISNLKESHAAPSSCRLFHTGTFKMTYMGKQTLIVRTASKQSQYFDNSKTPIEFAVKWVNDCTFKLIPLKSATDHPGVPANAVLTMQIVKTSKDSYTQITTANFTKQAITGEIYKVK